MVLVADRNVRNHLWLFSLIRALSLLLEQVESLKIPFYFKITFHEKGSFPEVPVCLILLERGAAPSGSNRGIG